MSSYVVRNCLFSLNCVLLLLILLVCFHPSRLCAQENKKKNNLSKTQSQCIDGSLFYSLNTITQLYIIKTLTDYLRVIVQDKNHNVRTLINNYNSGLNTEKLSVHTVEYVNTLSQYHTELSKEYNKNTIEQEKQDTLYKKLTPEFSGQKLFSTGDNIDTISKNYQQEYKQLFAILGIYSVIEHILYISRSIWPNDTDKQTSDHGAEKSNICNNKGAKDLTQYAMLHYKIAHIANNVVARHIDTVNKLITKSNEISSQNSDYLLHPCQLLLLAESKNNEHTYEKIRYKNNELLRESMSINNVIENYSKELISAFATLGTYYCMGYFTEMCVEEWQASKENAPPSASKAHPTNNT